LFLFSTLGVAICALATGIINPWIMASLIGVIYGTACAARGKVVPLYALEGHRSNTLVSGMMNAILVVGLLTGAVFGSVLFSQCDDDYLGKYAWFSFFGERWWRRIIIAGILLIGATLALKVTPREATPIPFRTGLHDLLAISRSMFRRYWALLIAGGLAWGTASAASLAGMIYAVDDLHLKFEQATVMVIFPAVGAIIGNLVSHWLDRRRYVIGALVVMAITIALFPLLSMNIPAAAVMMVLIGMFFAAPTNVLDAKLLACAAAEGDPGKGSTSMSLWHNVFILGIGVGLALPLFLGWMSAAGQFYFLGGMTIVTAIVTGFTTLSRSGGTVIDVEPVKR
jgi:predicted MFS family arabinose efflux permease